MEAELHRRSAAGEAGAWRELIRRHSPAIFRLSLRMLRSPEEAEDASQDVFARMYGSFDSYDPARPMGPWVSRITYNVCLSRIAKKGRMPQSDLDLERFEAATTDPEVATARSERHAALSDAVDSLPVQDRVLLTLRYREGMTQAEVAESVGMPLGTVKVRLHRARTKLRRHLWPQLGGMN